MPAGRPRKPTALKVLAGNPGKRALPEGEAKPEPKLPPPPRHLSRVAKAEWKRLGAQLERLGLITEVDLRAFEAYCMTYEQLRIAQEKVAELGMVAYTPQGYPMLHPWFTAQRKLHEDLMRMLREFGLTPASRSKVTPAAKSEDEIDPASAWMAGTG